MISLPKFVLLAASILQARQTLMAANDSVVVVANSSVSVESIAPDDLREIFLGTQHSLSDGSKVTPVLLKGGPTHELFLKSYLGKSVEGFRTWWLQVVFTGQGLLPKTFVSETELVDYVGRTRGAVGYATRGSVRGSVKYISVTSEHKNVGSVR